MFHSLRTRLFIVFVTVVALAVFVVAFFANRGTNDGFNNFIEQQTLQDEALIEQLLEQAVTEEDYDLTQMIVGQVSERFDRNITVTDRNNLIIAATEASLIGLRIDSSDIERGEHPLDYRITSDQRLRLTPPLGERRPASSPSLNGRSDNGNTSDSPSNHSQNQTDFLGSVSRAFWWATALAIGIAGLLSLALSRRIFNPLAALTTAAQKLEKGDLQQKVAITGKDEVATLGQAFNQMAESLAKQEQLRRNMVSDVAHELRTPLTNIRGHLEAIQDGVLEADEATIDSLYEEAMLLNHLIEDLQELALAEAGQLRMNIQPLSVEEVLETAVSSVQMMASRHNVTVTFQNRQTLPTVLADNERLSQILRNLLRNGIVYAPNGKIVVTAVPQNNHIHISIQDSGEGINPDHIPHLFERFYRIDGSRNRSTGGKGLGLAIVKALVEAQNGRIWVESQLGQGTTFHFTIPQQQ